MNTSNAHRAGGPVPKFTDYHLWKTLMVLDTKIPIGRKKMASVLGIGEGSTRTVLSMLESEGLIIINKPGVVLSQKGVTYRNSVYMDVFPIIHSDITINDCNVAVRIAHAAKRVTYGCEERDIAILAGATGATTLIYQSGYLMFPGSNYPVDDNLSAHLKNLFKLRNEDVVIIGTASDSDTAEQGAVSAALNLIGGLRIKKDLKDIISSKSTANEILSLAFAVHELMGGLPVCAKSKDNLGIRIEKGSVIDNAYTGDVLEEAISKNATIRRIAPSGPYKGTRVVVTPIEIDGKPIAAIGVVDIRGIPGSENFLRFT